MADDQFLGEIRITAFNFAPTGWAFCSGQLLEIQQNTALFSLLGTTYGGDGVRTFGLPDLRNRSPIQQGQGPGLSPYALGEMGGASAVTLSLLQLATHPHQAACDAAAGSQQAAAGGVWAASAAGRASPPYYATAATNLVAMSPAAIGMAGGNGPHNNRSPYLGLSFIIAIAGIYPSRP